MRLAWMNSSVSLLVAFLVLASVNVAVAQDSTPRGLFTIFPADPEAGQQVTLDASFSVDRGSGGSIATYKWDFGDGSTPFGPDPSPVVLHTFSAAGLYTISLTVADNDVPENEGVTERTLVVVAAGSGANGDAGNQLPTAVFTMSTAQSAVGDEVSFDAGDSSDEDGIKKCATSGDVCASDASCDDGESCIFDLQYSWDFGDGVTQDFSSDPKATHSYGAEGDFEVRLFVCDQATCDADTDISESFKQIEVLAAGTNIAPTAVVASGPRLASVGESLTFDGQLSFDPNGDQLDYAWNIRFEGLLLDPVLTSTMSRSFDLVGTYEITLEVFDGRGGSDEAETFTVVVTEAPPVVEPPATNPNPGNDLVDPTDSAAQRPTLTTCGLGMIPAMFGSLLGMFGMAVTRRRAIR